MIKYYNGRQPNAPLYCGLLRGVTFFPINSEIKWIKLLLFATPPEAYIVSA